MYAPLGLLLLCLLLGIFPEFAYRFGAVLELILGLRVEHLDSIPDTFFSRIWFPLFFFLAILLLMSLVVVVVVVFEEVFLSGLSVDDCDFVAVVALSGVFLILFGVEVGRVHDGGAVDD